MINFRELIVLLLLLKSVKSSSISVISDKKIESDVEKITIKDLAGDYSNNPAKEVVLDGKIKEKAVLYPKKNLFSKSFKIEECSTDGCKKDTVSNDEKADFDDCIYQGRLLSDQDSKVSLSQCNEDGVKDISIVSDKTNLTHDSYRVNKDGTVVVSQMVPKKNDNKEVLTMENKDRSKDESANLDDTKDLPVVFEKNTAFTVKDVNATCCRLSRLKCNAAGNKTEETKGCKVSLGKLLCDKKKSGRG